MPCIYLHNIKGAATKVIGNAIEFTLTATINLSRTTKSAGRKWDPVQPGPDTNVFYSTITLAKTFTRTLTVNRIPLPNFKVADGFTFCEPAQAGPDATPAFDLPSSYAQFCVFRYQPRTARWQAEVTALAASLLDGIFTAANCVTWFGNRLFIPKKFTDYVRVAGSPVAPASAAWSLDPTSETFDYVSDGIAGSYDMDVGFDVTLNRPLADSANPSWKFVITTQGTGGSNMELPGENYYVGGRSFVGGPGSRFEWPGNSLPVAINLPTLRKTGDMDTPYVEWSKTGVFPAPPLASLPGTPATGTASFTSTEPHFAGETWDVTAADSGGSHTKTFELIATGGSPSGGNTALSVTDGGGGVYASDVAASLAAGVNADPDLSPVATAASDTTSFTLTTIETGSDCHVEVVGAPFDLSGDGTDGPTGDAAIQPPTADEVAARREANPGDLGDGTYLYNYGVSAVTWDNSYECKARLKDAIT